jgi:hypothetical protein
MLTLNKNGDITPSTKISNRVSISKLSDDLGLNIKPHEFTGSFIPITMIKVKDLFVYRSFQRLVIKNVIRNAGRFRPELARPLYVFKRPDGTISVADGQHTGILAALYTTESENQELPCQVVEHDKDMSEEDCVRIEAKMFKDLNKFRTNVGVIDTLRANIALGDIKALTTVEQISSMGVHIEGIGEESGPEVWGYPKLMHSYNTYGLEHVLSAIELYQRLQNDSMFPKWNDIGKPLNGGLISGLAAVYHLIKTELGKGDRAYAVNYYLDNKLGKTNPTSRKNSLIAGTSGGSQSILIARRIVDAVNTSTNLGYIIKRDGEEFVNAIEETSMSKAGLGDPSGKVKES